MFEFSFTSDDLKRVAWTFVQAALAVLLAGALNWVNSGEVFDWKALVVGALAAGISAVKNFVLSNDSALK